MTDTKLPTQIINETLASPAPAQNGSSVPTTKVLAISHPVGVPMTAEQRAAIMPREVRETVAAYLSGKIDQWYVQSKGKGVVFVVNATTAEEAKAILEKFPLGEAGLIEFDYIPLGPLTPLRFLTDQPMH